MKNATWQEAEKELKQKTPMQYVIDILKQNENEFISAEEILKKHFTNPMVWEEKWFKRLSSDIEQHFEKRFESRVNAISDDYIQKKSLEILELVASQEYKDKEYIHEMHKMIIKCLETNY